MTFLKETIEFLKEEKIKPTDIKWIGSESFGWFTWNDFIVISDFDYDSGFGSQKVATDLVIVGKGWWLERTEYDGSEGWEFKTAPQKPKKKNVPKSVGGDEHMWDSLSEINK